MEFYFFFFKQKTAYEILTCDWSSDVCSSDLYDDKEDDEEEDEDEDSDEEEEEEEEEEDEDETEEIGRASCRERV